MRYAEIQSGQKTWVIGDDALARGPGSRYIIGAAPGFRQIVQSIAYLGGAFTTQIAQGNRDVRFSIAAEYEFNDEGECFLFVCNLANNCPGAGILKMGVHGNSAAEFVYPGCVVESVTPLGDLLGTSVKLAYALAVGRPA